MVAGLVVCVVMGVTRQASRAEFTPFAIPEDQVKVVLHVDGGHSRAADTNPGTEGAPFKTIGAAVTVAMSNKAQNIGTKILIAPGVYREEVLIEIPDYKDNTPPGSLDKSEAPLVIEARQPGTVILEGADVWADGWTREPDGRTWSHEWTNKWGVAPDPYGYMGVVFPEICRRREMVWIDGRPVRQVLDRAELRPGTFHVAEPEGKLYLCPPRQEDPQRLRPEVARRSRLLEIDGLRNVIVRGLVTQHAASYQFTQPFAIKRTLGVLVEDCTVRWNNWHGFLIWGSTDVVLRRLKGNENGEGNFIGRCRNLLAQDVEASRNNWRGDWGHYYACSVHGIKVMFNRGLTFRRFRAEDNLTGALWFDSDNADVVLEDCVIYGGLGGVTFEHNQGPVVVSNCVVAGSRVGVVIDTTANGVLTDCVLYGNGVQILVQGPVNRVSKDFAFGKELLTRCEHWAWRNNIVVGTNAALRPERTAAQYWRLVACEPLVSMPLWEHFLVTLSSSGNLWWHPRPDAAFQIGELGFQREPCAGLSLDEWQLVTGQDLDALFAAPCLVAPEQRDFRLRADSPARCRGKWPRVTSAELEQRLGHMMLDVRRHYEQQRKLRQGSAGVTGLFPLARSAKPEDFKPLALGTALNRPLTGDEGWIGAPLTQLLPGRHIFGGVPFEVTDRAVALRSARVNRTAGVPVPAEVTVPVGRKARAVYLLHGSGWVSVHEKVAEYSLLYFDGATACLPVIVYGSASDAGPASVKLSRESNVQDWHGAHPQFENERVKPVALPSPDGTPRYLYVVEWPNPHPEKVIQSLRLTSDPEKNASVLVLAVTLLE